MTEIVRLAALSLLAGFALPGAAFGADGLVTVPEPVDRLQRADKDCLEYDQSHPQNARIAAKLDANQTLYVLPCYTGAYNTIYRVYVLATRYPEELRPGVFASYFDATGWHGKAYLINAVFDPKTKTLSAFEKGRGLGDCGSIPSYRWTDYGWRMIEYRYWGKCDGSEMPDDWPVIFRFKSPRR